MRKKERHQLIIEMVSTSRLTTQKEIQERLRESRIDVTQTTLSRDLHELGLMKARDKDGVFYVLPGYQERQGYVAHLASYVRKVERTSFILVLHTKLGEAGVASNVVDGAKPYQILGTVAGADTIIVICRDEDSAKMVERELNERIVD